MNIIIINFILQKSRWKIFKKDMYLNLLPMEELSILMLESEPSLNKPTEYAKIHQISSNKNIPSSDNTPTSTNIKINQNFSIPANNTTSIYIDPNT